MPIKKQLLIFIFAIMIIRIVIAIYLPVAPQEAYYWNYSNHPDISYFDHPPMASYLIKLTTLFGTTSFTVHLSAILISILLSFALFELGRLLFDEKIAFWTVVATNLTFIYGIGSVIITPDVPLLLFWVMAMIACIKIGRNESKIWWILLGIFIGAGFASKYSIVFAGLGVLIFLLSSKERISHFKTIWPYISLVCAFITALPVIYWNYQHNWASFIFQSENRVGGMNRFRFDYFFAYIGTLIGIYGVIPVPILAAGIWDITRRAFKEKKTELILLASFSVPMVLFFLPVSLRSWVKMNWTAPAFIGWFLAGTAYYFSKFKVSKFVSAWGKVSLAFLAITFLAVPIIALSPDINYGRGDYFAGWQDLAAVVQQIRNDMPEPYFICGYEYKTASMLAFYLDDHPETVSNNIFGLNGLQYDYWCDPDTLAGRNGIIVYDERISLPVRSRASDRPSEIKLEDFFDHVGPDLQIEIKKAGKKITSFHIIECYGYKGNGK